MRWYGLRVMTDRAIAGGTWQLLWEASVAGEQADEGNALFASREAGDCVTVYFSPSAGLLATALGAGRCAKPASQGLTLLAGAQRAWDVHFSAEAGAERALRVRAA